MKTRRHIILCSSVAVEYYLFLARCVVGETRPRQLVYALGEAHYRKLARGGLVARFWMRFLMYVLYPLRLLWVVLSAKKGSLLIVTSNTFFAPALIASVGWLRGVRVIHVLYDLFPDALEVAGALKRDGLVARLLGWVAHVNNTWPIGVVFLGDHLRRHAESRWGKARHTAIIDISTDTSLYPDSCPLLAAFPIGIHYGGQLGAMHDAEALAAAVVAATADPKLSPQIKFSFAISGSRELRFKALCAGSAVSIGATIASSKWRSFASTMHIGMVTLTPGGATVCLPSKTYAMMASGMAIIAICPISCDLASLINTNDAGWVIDNTPGEPLGLSAGVFEQDPFEREKRVAHEMVVLLDRIQRSPEELNRKRMNAHRAAHGRYGVAAIEQQWAAFLEEIDAC